MNQFPPHVQEKLKALDADGSGYVDADEVVEGVRALEREKQRTKSLMWLIVGLFVFLVLLLAATGGVLFFVIDATKESRTDSSGVLLAKGSGTPVQVASVDFSVVDGMLVPKNVTCGGGVCPNTPLQVTQVFGYHTSKHGCLFLTSPLYLRMYFRTFSSLSFMLTRACLLHKLALQHRL